MKNYIKLLFACVLLLGIGTACSNAATTQPAAVAEEKPEVPETITFEDSTGKEFTLELPLERVVVINRNTAEALKVLGVDKEIIATGDTTLENNPYLGFEDRPDVGKTSEINFETILSLNPQVVFTFTNRPDSTLEEKLEPAGIQVVRINNYLPESMDEELQLLGKLFGKEEKAAEFLTWKHGIEELLEKRVADIPDDEKKTVMALSVGALNSQGAYQVFPSQSLDGKPGVGEGVATLLAGGIDAADLQWDPSEASTTIRVDEEYVLERNPEVLTLHGTWLGGYETTDFTEYEEVYQHLLNTTSIPKLSAGKTEDVYIFHTNIIGSDKRYIGTLQLAKYLYPERFEDIDPDAYLKEYFEKWLGVENQGIWYYTPTEKD
ncbi:ABC-type Fe3+-hydroxamate transport system, periplasmic component [Bacillus sp. OxB-1]|uniref:ABC transporter substrate-binding protein n=1 Tax=Bacillus sp. (strain OxB-1) TaxID=98228 RepID=UPI000581C078|nr:ABC transporter substrate-binding protein [Bacillus sp. OxB-1]BAQ09709.1 ABC-type Fe3+-hydroxamate transport system, periplasmic component [Bacillus sp. OxB-1]